MKRNIYDLAILGGEPAFNEKLHVGRPNIGNSESLLRRINDILYRRWLTNNGVYVQEFERRIAEMLDVRNCIAMCNGTVALEITIRAIGLADEVIIPSFTFVATAHSLKWQEITPVFCDIDPNSHNIDPSKIENMITPNTTGIIGVHVWGRPCDIENLSKIAEKHKLKLLFDAAHAFGCSYKGNMIGGFGDAEVFSFHATKFLNTFEGGAVATNNDKLAEKIRLMKNFGFTGQDKVIYIGTNGKMNEISAAMGLSSLEAMDEFISANYDNYKHYALELDAIPGVHLIPYDEKEKSNYQYVALEVDEEITKISRDQIVEIMHGENVIARRYFYPGCHKMEPYRSYYPHAGLLLGNTEKLIKRVMTLPTGTAIGKPEISKICNTLRLVFQKAPEVSRALKKTGRKEGNHE